MKWTHSPCGRSFDSKQHAYGECPDCNTVGTAARVVRKLKKIQFPRPDATYGLRSVEWEASRLLSIAR